MSSYELTVIPLNFECTWATTDNREARAWFTNGWIHCLGFNNEEAVRCFEQALLCDASMVAAHLALAVALGTNYNDPAGLDLPRAFVHVTEASAALTRRESAVHPFEIALAHALRARYVSPPSSVPQAELDARFSAASRAMLAAHVDEADAVWVHAMALMNHRPWLLWDRRDLARVVPAGPETTEVVALLELGLSAHSAHPGLCHLYIHAMELGPTPSKALVAANTLRHMSPDHGHLMHMPSHIDMWVGDFAAAVDANVRAVAADDKYVALAPAANRINYYLGYRVHNMHFVVWAAMFAGRYSQALEFAHRLECEVDDDVIRFGTATEPDLGRLYYESFLGVAWHVLVRFGKWAAILAKPVPTDLDLHACTVATAHYARGVAFAALRRLDEAQAESLAFQRALANPHLKGRMLHNNAMVSACTDTGALPQHTIHTAATFGILHVAEAVLAGEIAFAAGDYGAAFAHLRTAVTRDIGLQYDEPHGWMMPARHALGALLLHQGTHAAEAADVLRADLSRLLLWQCLQSVVIGFVVSYPGNVWALTGLEMALGQLGTPSAAISSSRLAALAQATEPISHACCCAV